MQTYPSGPKAQWQHQAEQIVKGVIPTSIREVPMLLEWLKDMNWPGAEIIARHLPSYGEGIGPSLVKVLESGDTIWIRWVLAALSDSFDDRFWQALRPAIQRIAYSKDIEGSAAEALYIMARYRLDAVSTIQAAVIEAKSYPGADSDDYCRVESVLSSY
jgi:hypothetical protein